jgi:hypothetical protein
LMAASWLSADTTMTTIPPCIAPHLLYLILRIGRKIPGRLSPRDRNS